MAQPIDAIDRTPEYEEFMRQLREFHESKGTTMQAEPVLGGKKLDLLKIYKIVMEGGGHEKVTQNRGWKQVGDPFDFPPTCTNSAFVLKSIYYKNLLGWEEEKVWKRPWNPPREMLEQQRGNTRTSSPLPAGASLKPRDAARQTATALTDQPSQNAAHPPSRQPISYAPPFPSMPNMHYFPPVFMDEEFRARILLALKSTLPNEVDWAFNTLVKFSYASENFSLDYMPTLLDSLLEFAEPLFFNRLQHVTQQNPKYTSSELLESMFSNEKRQEEIERCLQVFHILRNFSFLEMNIRRLANHAKLRHMLMIGISAVSDSQYAELSRHCLDILENIAPQVIVTSPTDPYLMAMSYLLYTNDRALILGAIRSLTRVAVTEINERVLGTGNVDIIRRMAQFLLVDDEVLVAATLEYFYQCSSLRGNFSTHLVSYYPGNLIGLLVGYLSYKSPLAGSTSQSLTASIHGIPASQLAASKNKPQQPTIPDLTDYAHLDEPYRCLGWLKEKLVSAELQDTLRLQEIFSQYSTLFGADKPLGMKEFYTVLKIAFPQPASVEASVSNNSTPLDQVELRNIKYAPAKAPEEILCQWKECKDKFETEADLHQHIVMEHLKEDAHEADKDYRCEWMECGRDNFKNKTAIVRHLRTHFAGKIRKRQKKGARFVVDKLSVDDSEVSGVPLTAALLLRNLVQYKQHHSHYMPYEGELTTVAVQRPRLAKYILSVLADLQVT